MPKKTKPKTGWRERGLAGEERRVFTSENTSPGDPVDELNEAASWYLSGKQRDDGPKPSEQRAALTQAFAAAESLYMALTADLDSLSKQRLLTAYNGSRAALQADIAALRRLKDGLELAWRTVPEAGRPRKDNTYSLIRKLSKIWERSTGRKFVVGKDARKYPAEEVSAWARIIDPTIDESTINRAFKEKRSPEIPPENDTD
jgi:hypothetical protein